jgi:ABC-type antimicrobial peptide transport system permease subunit
MPRSTFVVRTPGDPYALADAVRRSIAAVDPALPLYGVLSMDDVLASSLDPRRFRLLLLGVFAAAALLLAGVGLYGVISFSVGQRTREIGIRMAIGAGRDTVIRDVVRLGLLRVALGLGLGTLASLALTRAIASQVFGVRATDPLTYLGSALLLAIVAGAACLVPAIRAARIDPAIAVRDA